MEVLLKSTVRKLGRRGEVVKVAAGYARNYLLPKGFAVEVTASDRAQIEAERRRMAKEDAERRESLKAQLDALSAVSVTIEMRANPEGHLYGSVAEQGIAEALAAEGHEVGPEQVHLDSHIKELGVYDVDILLAEGAGTKVKVWVVAAGGGEEGEGEESPGEETEEGEAEGEA